MKGHEIIKYVVRKEMPDTELIREECHRQVMQSVQEGSAWDMISFKKAIPLIAAFVMLIAVSTSVFAFYGGFERFIERIDPPFADIIMPVMYYSEDQGIRLTMLGAQQYGRNAVVYLSIQDVSGENRITEHSGLGGIDICRSGESARFQSWGMSFTYLYFDETSNTQYIQLLLRFDRPLPPELILETSQINLGGRGWSDERNTFHLDIVRGNWRVTAYFEEGETSTDSLEHINANEIRLEGPSLDIYGIHFVIDSITINPISLYVIGRATYSPREMAGVYRSSYFTDYVPVPKTRYELRRLLSSSVHIETIDGIIELNVGGGGSTGGGGRMDFENTYWVESPLDLERITAVFIGGERIPVN